jgi:hypothetical protein
VVVGEGSEVARRPSPHLDDAHDEVGLGSCSALVVLPTLNEEEGLDRTLAALPPELHRNGDPTVRVVVIDGGSTDGTVEVARRAHVPVLRQQGRGKGEALVEAVEWARSRRISHVVVLDADATYPPDQIEPALALLRAGTDLVVGVRRPVWGPPRTVRELVHRAGNVLLSGTASLLSGQTILDVCSGFWGVSTEKFCEIRLGEAEFAIEAELVVKSLRAGLRVAQIPVRYSDRVGQSKLRTWSDGGAIFLSILQFARSAPRGISAHNAARTRLPHLLSIGVITSPSGARIACDAGEQLRAEELARALRTGLPQVHVEVGEALPVRSEGGRASRPPLVVRFPRRASGDPHAPVTVAIHTDEHRLSIRLPPARGEPENCPTEEPRGGRPARDVGTRWSAVLAVVTSRLNYDLVVQHRAMLWANGLSIEDPARPKGGREVR